MRKTMYLIMFRGIINFVCDKCGHSFEVMDCEYQCTAYSQPVQCPNYLDGSNRGRHKLYESSEKSTYICKYCGHKFSSIIQMVGGTCVYNPKGSNKGNHVLAL